MNKTEHKKLLSSNKLLRDMLDLVPLGCTIINEDKSIVFVNKNFIQLFDCKSRKECAKNFWAFSTEYQDNGKRSIELAHQYIEEAYKVGFIDFFWLHKNLQGEIIPARVHLEKLVYNGSHALVSYIDDLRPEIAIQKAKSDVEKRTSVMLNASPLCCTFWNINGGVIDCNDSALRMFEVEDKEKFLAQFFEFSPEYQPDGTLSKNKAKILIKKAFKEGYLKFEWDHKNAKGDLIPAEIVLVRMDYNKSQVVLGYCTDLREYKAMRTKIDTMLDNARLDARCFRELAIHTNMIIVEWNYEIKKEHIFHSLDELIALSNLKEKNYNDVIHSSMIHPHDRQAHKDLLNKIKLGLAPDSIKLRFKKANGEYRWCFHSAIVIHKEDGKPYKSIGFIEDIHDAIIKEKAMELKAQTDMLTSMYNKNVTRALISDILNDSSPCSRHAMICLDLDNFKGINDTFGHLIGDNVLIEVASKMRQTFRSSDILGRFGGDEFVIFMYNVTNNNFIKQKANSLCRLIRKTYEVAGIEKPLSASLGISVFPDDGTSYEELYKKADSASYHAKRTGKNKVITWEEMCLESNNSKTV